MLPFLAVFADLELHVVALDRRVADPEVREDGGVTIHRLPRPAESELWNAIGPGRRAMSEYVMRLKPDVVHARDTYGLMVQGLPIPRVLSIHGFIHADTALQQRRLARLRAAAWRFVEVRGWAQYPHIISISPYVRERLTGVASGVIHDVENPVHVSFFNVERRDSSDRVLFAGPVSRLKNPMAVLRAVAGLGARGRRIRVRLAGRCGEPAYGRELAAYAGENGLGDRVAFLGHLDRTELQHELATASVFVLPSLQENAPVAIGEAMAVGVPVIASNRCGMPYMVRDGESGFLVDPNSPAQIAQRLDELLEDDTLRARMGEEGRKFALDHYHPARVAARTREVYFRAVRDQEHRELSP